MFRATVCVLVLCFVNAYGLICFFHGLPCSIKPAPPTVKTKNGTVQGYFVDSSSTPLQYIAFEGIPYAKPPIGNLRFELPEPPNNWTSTLMATNARNNCIHSVDFGTSLQGTEDCLYLNIYVPPKLLHHFPRFPNPVNVRAEPRFLPMRGGLPVMVFIHGGYYNEGSANFSSYKPDHLMDKNNVIVITVAYRLGILGFATTGNSVLSGNLGLKDQVLALKWVRDNIKFFGGNPTLVTIFGGGAGSSAVSLHLLSPRSKGLFRGAILESGSSLNPWAMTTANVARNGLIQVSRRLKIKCATWECLISKMKRFDANELVREAQAVQFSDFTRRNILNNLLIFAPVIELNSTSAFLTSKPYENFLNGKFNHVPTIIGLNSQESLIPDTVSGILRLHFDRYLKNPSLLVPQDMNVANKTVANLVGTQIRNFYFSDKEEVPDKQERIIQFLSDIFINKGVKKQAQLQSNRSNRNVYFYKFSYVGNLTNPRNNSLKINGASHAEERLYIWANSKRTASCLDKTIILRMLELWTNFAYFGNPTPEPDIVLNNIDWPPVLNISHMTYLDINNELTVDNNLFDNNLGFWDNLYTKYGRQPFNTY